MQQEATFSMDDFRSGDRVTFTAVYQQFVHAIHDMALHFVRQREVAEDITAESFIKLYRASGNLRSHAHVRNFLYHAARTACIDYLRTLQVHQRHRQEAVYLGAEAEEKAFDTELIRKEFIRQIYLEIETLPPVSRQVFKHLFIDGKKPEEVAVLMDISASTVRSHKAAALHAIRNNLLKKGMLEGIYILLWWSFLEGHLPIRDIL